jgi:hypothetical protein
MRPRGHLLEGKLRQNEQAKRRAKPEAAPRVRNLSTRGAAGCTIRAMPLSPGRAERRVSNLLDRAAGTGHAAPFPALRVATWHDVTQQRLRRGGVRTTRPADLENAHALRAEASYALLDGRRCATAAEHGPLFPGGLGWCYVAASARRHASRAKYDKFYRAPKTQGAVSRSRPLKARFKPQERGSGVWRDDYNARSDRGIPSHL